MSKNNQKTTLASRISKQFLNGLIVVVPPVITAFIVMWILNLTEGKLGKLIEQYLQIKFPGIGLITIIIFIWIIGLITGNIFAKKIIHFLEWLLEKIPVVKFIYGSVKQFSRAVLDYKSSFKHVVLVPYHQDWTIGFLMNNIPSAVREKIGVDYVCVFIPWSLNMTSGTNLFVKRQDIIFVNMTPEDALQFILTAGTVAKK